MSRIDAYRFGHVAEWLAAAGLWLGGYRIVARRYKTPQGEIDLIAQRGDVLVFVEVKARKDMAAALAALTPNGRQRISRAAAIFLSRHQEFAGCAPRFDLVAMAPPFYWRHLDNAWQVTT